MKNLGRLLMFVLLTTVLGWPQSQINSFQILRMGKQSTAPANPPINASYVYFDGTNVVCVTSSGASCLASSGGSGTVTSIATTSPIGGGTITGTGTLTCTTCVVASSPGSGVAHFAGSTQTVTSSAIVAADITSGTITGTQLSSSIALPNGATATTQSASDNSTKVATTAYVDALSSGALVKICTLTASSSAALNFLAANCPNSANPFSSTYDEYLISVKNITPATNGSALQMRMSTNGTSCDSGSSPGYSSVNFSWFSAGNGNVSGSANSGLNAMFVGDDHTSNVLANGGLSSSLHLFSPASSTINKNITGTTYNWNNAAGPAPVGAVVMDSYQSATAVLGFCLFFNSGNIATGSTTVYGIVK